jgi:hypothetical protein
MATAGFAALGAVGGALITAACTVIVFAIGQRRRLQNDHLQRAFERHLDRYEKVFVSARTAQDSLHNYRAISGKVDDRSDPFLFQLLTIAENACHDYCVAVTWSHNPGMLYLGIDLEGACLRARDLLLRWLENCELRRDAWCSRRTTRRGASTRLIDPSPKSLPN